MSRFNHPPRTRNLVLFLLALWLAPASHGAVLSGPAINPANGHAYYLLTSATWAASEAEAQTLGGHLVTINDQAENTWVYTNFANFGGSNRCLWIGLNDQAVEGIYVWAGGDPAGFLNWFDDQPDDITGTNDFAVMYSPADFRTNFWGDFGAVANSTDQGGSIPIHGVVEVTNAPPVITLHPQSQVASNDATVAFTVAATGTPALAYQWLFNGTNLPGATGTNLTLSNVTVAQAGSYWVVVTNAYGAATSVVAVLNVAVCVPRPPDIISWWRAESNGWDSISGNHSILAGGVTFPTGLVNRAFRYNATTTTGSVIKNKPNLDAGTNAGFTIEGWVNAVSVATSIPIFDWNDPSGNLGAHFWILTPGSLYGNFMDAGGGNRIVQSVDNIIPAGSYQHVAVTLNRLAGEAKLYLNGAVIAQTNLGSFQPRTAYDAYIGYRPYGGVAGRKFNGDIDELTLYGRALSGTEISNIYLAGALGKCTNDLPPVIIQQPLSQAVEAGTNALFTVAATGTATLTYQWQFNGTNVPGATSTNLVITNVTPAQVGFYSVIVSNSFGVAVSSNAALVIACARLPGLISWWPAEGSAVDLVSSNNGALLGTFTFPAGHTGLAFGFNGSNSSISVSNTSANLNAGTNAGLTLEGWVNPVTTVNAIPIFDWNDSSGSLGAHFWILNGGALFGNFVDTGGANHFIQTTNNAIPAGVFSHVALSYDKVTGEARLYVNGLTNVVTNLGSFTPRTTYNVYLGYRPFGAGAGLRMHGLIDELALYGRALTPLEIYSRFSDHCTNDIRPIITQHPTNHAVVRGTDVTFTVAALGSPALVYQWLYNGSNIAGGNATTLTLTNVQVSQSGIYSVLVTNLVGATNSFNATLTVTNPVAIVRAVTTRSPAGSDIVIPVLLVAIGDENALSFTFSYPSNLLTLTSLALGADATAGTLYTNGTQTNAGRIGLDLQLPFGQTFTLGTQQVALLGFRTAPITNTQTATLAFSNSPTQRDLLDVNSVSLPVTFLGTNLVITNVGFEGDVSPRTNSNKVLSSADWTQTGRYVLGLDPIAGTNEFQRADSAPRSAFGDGALTLTDWVQAGRYFQNLDPLSAAAGPLTTNAYSGPGASALRNLRAATATFAAGQTNTLAIQLIASGNENAASFTLGYNTNVLRFVSASAGADAAGASVLFNTNTPGAAAFLVGLPAGSAFSAGTNEIMIARFFADPAAVGVVPAVLGSSVVFRQISDALANDLPGTFTDGLITLDGTMPVLDINRTGMSYTLGWPITGPGLLLETRPDFLPANPWAATTNLVNQVGVRYEVIYVTGESNRYYRLRRP